MRATAIIPAAGFGTRMGKPTADSSRSNRKQFMLLAGEPVLLRTIRKFTTTSHITRVLVALLPDDIEGFNEILKSEKFSTPVQLVVGGRNRQESVANCLGFIQEDTEVVVVHDAVRPFVTVTQIELAINEARDRGAVIFGVPPVDTVKRVDRTLIQSTLFREQIVLAQTPQAFRFSLLRDAFERAKVDHFVGTDEASLVEHLGENVHVLLGSDRNIKITRPTDMALATLFHQEEMDP